MSKTREQIIADIKSQINNNKKQAISGDRLQGVLVDMTENLAVEDEIKEIYKFCYEQPAKFYEVISWDDYYYLLDNVEKNTKEGDSKFIHTDDPVNPFEGTIFENDPEPMLYIGAIDLDPNSQNYGNIDYELNNSKLDEALDYYLNKGKSVVMKYGDNLYSSVIGGQELNDNNIGGLVYWDARTMKPAVWVYIFEPEYEEPLMG